MKKIYLILFIFCIFVGVAKADYECMYEATIPPSTSLSASMDVEGKVIVKPDSNEFDFNSTWGMDDTVILDSKISSKWTNEKLMKLLEGKYCPSNVYVCLASAPSMGGSGQRITAIILNNTLIEKLKYPFAFNATNKTLVGTPIPYIIPEENWCQIGTLNTEKSTGIKLDVEFPCEFVEDRIDDMESIFCKVGEEGCNSSSIQKYNNQKKELKSYCNQVLKYQDYTNDCVTSCLSLEKRINDIEGIKNNGPYCGFSEKLIQWIANIVKWLKYIVPVIVIVLGILDFIKAIASEKDDEMKKAQGRFTKRLIAAALIFIIPFIIEFILGKMGFAANSCGIIDL